MAIKNLNPYINLNGTAEKAIALYASALGAKVGNVMRYTDLPNAEIGPEHKNRVMHVALEVGGGVIMLSDGMPGRPVPTESNVHITLNFDDLADMGRKFEALAAGGKVTMALADTFWGARFGMLTDAFGVNWMFNCEHRKS